MKTNHFSSALALALTLLPSLLIDESNAASSRTTRAPAPRVSRYGATTIPCSPFPPEGYACQIATKAGCIYKSWAPSSTCQNEGTSDSRCNPIAGEEKLVGEYEQCGSGWAEIASLTCDNSQKKLCRITRASNEEVSGGDSLKTPSLMGSAPQEQSAGPSPAELAAEKQAHDDAIAALQKKQDEANYQKTLADLEAGVRAREQAAQGGAPTSTGPSVGDAQPDAEKSYTPFGTKPSVLGANPLKTDPASFERTGGPAAPVATTPPPAPAAPTKASGPTYDSQELAGLGSQSIDKWREFEKRKTEEAKGAGSKAEKAPEAVANDAEHSSDPCSVSTTVNNRFSCRNTTMLVEGVQKFNAITQTVQSQGLQIAGSVETKKAASSKNLGTSYESAAKLAKISGTAETTIGAVNMVGAMVQWNQGQKHSGNAAKLGELSKANPNYSAVVGPDGKLLYRLNKNTELVDEAFVSLQGLHDHAQLVDSKTAAADKRKLNAYGRQAVGEQENMKSKANTGAFLSLQSGMAQIIKGTQNLAAAKQYEQAAKNLKSAQGPAVAAPNYDPLAGGSGNAQLPRSPTAITNNGAIAAAAQEEEEKAKAPDLGGPLGAEPPSGLAQNAPPSDPFKVKDLSPSGGSGGGLGGGSAGPISGGGSGDGDSSPRMAEAKTPGYESAGGGSGGMGAVTAGGRGGSGGGGPDFAGMLAQFLPKTAEEQNNGTEAEQWGRKLASEPNSILGQNSMSLFDRASLVNSEKYRKGMLR